jgi:6-phosphogluconolactonase (cycloisomerase 2 family)
MEYGSGIQFGKFIYVIAFDQTNAALKIWTFSVTGANGELTALNNSPTAIYGGNPLIDTKHGRLYTNGVSIEPGGNEVFELTPYTVDPDDGDLTAGNTFVEKSSQGTFLVPTIDPFGRFIYEIADTTVGTQIFVYAISPSTGELSEAPGSPFLLAPASGPINYTTARVFTSPSGSFLNASFSGGQMLVNDVFVFSVDPNTGALSPIPGSPFPNNDVQGTPIVMAPSGNFMYAQADLQATEGGGGDAIQVFAVDPVLGAIGTTPLSTFSYAGTFFGESLIDPSGNVLISTGQFSNDATAYSFTINATTGAMTQAAESPYTLPDYASPPSTTYESSFFVRTP